MQIVRREIVTYDSLSPTFSSQKALTHSQSAWSTAHLLSCSLIPAFLILTLFLSTAWICTHAEHSGRTSALVRVDRTPKLDQVTPETFSFRIQTTSREKYVADPFIPVGALERQHGFGTITVSGKLRADPTFSLGGMRHSEMHFYTNGG